MEYVHLPTLQFLLREVHQFATLLQLPRYAHLDEASTDLMMQAAKDYADKAMYPFFKEMDEQQPARWENGRVLTHPQIEKILHAAGENGWIGGRDDFENGGMQLPETLHAFIHIIFEAANNAAQGYLGLSAGAARLISTFGTRDLVDAYVPNIYAGKWQGTMALTEPQAGSALTDITTAAYPTEQGYYHIKGQKIFISAGDHAGAENFVHLTLARIEGAPPGVKGISLFVVPRLRPNGNTLEYNDIQTAGDFQKLGQRGYSTTHLVYGEHDDCRGWLLGEPNKGLNYMFQMMNEARIGVGHSAAAVAMAAYMHAHQYAQERPQGRLPGNRDPLTPPVLIIRHADVQRMLLTQQCIIEASLSLAAECSILTDLHLAHPDELERAQALLLLEILTPVMKAYATEQGIRSVSLGLQVLGGYGYTIDFPLQQYYRDIRIMAIYEGTTGIQSLDLLGRKVLMENGAAFKLLLSKMLETAESASWHDSLAPYTDLLTQEINRLEQVTRSLAAFALAGQAERFTADATVYMEMTGLVVMAWQWLKIGQVALEEQASGRFPADFYQEKIRCMRFFYRHELPHAAACAHTLLNPEPLYE